MRLFFAVGGLLVGAIWAQVAFLAWQWGGPLLGLSVIVLGTGLVLLWAAWYGSWSHAAAVVRRRRDRELRAAGRG